MPWRPDPQSSSLSAVAAWAGAGTITVVGNVLSFADSFNAGAAAAGISGVGFAGLGLLIAYWRAKADSHKREAEQEIELDRRRDEARKGMLSVQVEELRQDLLDREERIKARDDVLNLVRQQVKQLQTAMTDEQRQVADIQASRERWHAERNQINSTLMSNKAERLKIEQENEWLRLEVLRLGGKMRAIDVKAVVGVNDSIDQTVTLAKTIQVPIEPIPHLKPEPDSDLETSWEIKAIPGGPAPP